MAREMFQRLGLAPEQRDDGRVPDRQPSRDVAGRVPPRHRRSRRSSSSSPALVGVEERLKMLCLMTLADVEAVSLGDADAVARGAAVAAVRRHLQPADARLRRRTDRARIRPALASCWPDVRRICPSRTSPAFSRGCRDAICSFSRATPSTGTSGCRATSIPTKCISRSNRRATPGN